MPGSNEQHVKLRTASACVPVEARFGLGDLPRLLQALPHLSDDEADDIAHDVSLIQSSVQPDTRPIAWE